MKSHWESLYACDFMVFFVTQLKSRAVCQTSSRMSVLT